jgi:hypothetical protein
MSKSLSVEQITKVGLFSLFSLFSLFDDRRLKEEMLMLKRIDDQTFNRCTQRGGGVW